jgi:putative ABC transport system permease protein
MSGTTQAGRGLNMAGVRRFPARLAGWIMDLVSSFFSSLSLVLKRLKYNLGLTISAVLGVVAVLAIVVCVPVFSNAVSSEVLRQQLNEKALSTRRRLFSMHMYYLDKRTATAMDVSKSEAVARYITDSSPQLLGLDVERIIMEMQTIPINLRPVKVQAQLDPEEPWVNMGFATNEILPDNATIVEGKWPEFDDTGSALVEVAILEDTADANFLNVGDIYQSGSLEVEIVGLWKPVDPSASVWFELPRTAYLTKMWVPLKTFQERLSIYLNRQVFYTSWYVIMGEKNLEFERAPQYARGMVRMDAELRNVLPDIVTDYSPLDALKAYQQRAETLTTLLYAVGGPMVVLALLFISQTASIAVQQYQQETATMRGRGMSWMQVVMLNLMESLLLLLLAILPALLVGWMAAGLMGKTVSFLKFTNRADIPFSFEGINMLWLGISALFIVVARFMPVLSLSRTTIVRVKQEQSRASRKPLWQRLFLDFLLLLPGIYAYVTLSGLAGPTQLLNTLQSESAEHYRDPLLFVAPALFAMAVCMIVLRILPLLLRLLAKLVDRLPGVWAYLSLQQIARRPQDHSSALLLIMISLSLSIFSASSAKTLDQWLHDSSYYKAGTDLVVHEYVMQSGGSGGMDYPTSGPSEAMMVESYLTVEDHLKLPSVESATRVGKFEGTFSYGVGEQPAAIMGIDRLDFPQTAFFRRDFARESLGSLMNALGAEPMGVLVPRYLAQEIGFGIGDRLNVSLSVMDQLYERDMVIVGFFDYFPTIYPEREPTLVVNLESIFDNPDSAVGYDIWLNVRENTDIELLKYQIRGLMGTDNAVVQVNANAFDEVKTMMEQPERVGLFGVLNVGFLATGLMPGIGFVLYSYASLRRRFVQLGILQAIGLSVKQLIGHLVLEQFLLMGLAIIFGAAVGLLSSYLFVPFMQVGASPGRPVPPFEVLIGWVESGWLSLAFGLVLFLTVIGTIVYLARIKVFQAVKMGESM